MLKMEDIICSSEKNDVESEFGGSKVVTEKRRTYRVETFIIPRKMKNNNSNDTMNNNNNNNKIFRSTEELDLDYHPDREEKSNDHEKGEDEVDEEVGTLEFRQLSLNPPAAVAGDEVTLKEFVSVNLEEKFGSNSPRKQPMESLCNIDKHDFEEGRSCGGSPAENIKQDDDGGEVDPFLSFDGSLDFRAGEELGPVSKNMERSHSYDFLPTIKPGSDLKSIKESCEVSYGSCEELCHHGNKNGCTVAAQSPSQLSEEIFKENWMQRLEFLRRRVSLIRDKEVALQERERVLLKKEKELRILERLVKEKVQRADLYLKRCTIRNSINLEDELRPNLFLYELSRPSPPPYPEKPHINVEENNNPDSREILSAGSRTSNRSKESSSNSTRSGSSRGERDSKQTIEKGNSRTLESVKNLPPRKTVNSKTNSGLQNNPKNLESANNIEEQKDLRRSKWSAYSSWRSRSRPKMSYDDLDSTLSADIGDSSFAITSKKLDPRLVRKPRGFSRSASERGPKNRPCSLDLDVDLGPDGERVLRKISENITAVASERQGTKFQNYGSIDIKRHKSEPKIDDLVVQQDKISVQCSKNNKNSCRTESANTVTGKDQLKSRKDRPSFWNEEASDWLRKKRQAYNLATKRMANRDYENNKENFGNSKNSQCQISEKQSKSKNEKAKKFTIFR